MMTATRFQLGRILATPGALAALTAAQVHPLKLLTRHAHGDWGDLHEFDRDANELALRQGLRILSAYALPTGDRIWIITEADRSVTTFLTPEEY
jgi:hypothetical protein